MPQLIQSILSAALPWNLGIRKEGLLGDKRNVLKLIKFLKIIFIAQERERKRERGRGEKGERERGEGGQRGEGRGERGLYPEEVPKRRQG